MYLNTDTGTYYDESETSIAWRALEIEVVSFECFGSVTLDPRV